MGRHRITPDSAEQRYPELWQFLGSYLHEDSVLMYGSDENALDTGINEYPPDLRLTVHAQLAAVLEATEDDIDLRRILNRCFGVNLFFRKPREARTFAQMVEQKLAASLKQGKRQ